MRRRAAVWLRRYLPAELASLVGALLAAHAGLWLSGNNMAVAAVAAAWGETIVYYTVIGAGELAATRADVLVTLRNLILEFGVAETLDSLLIRPALIYAAGQILADMQLGVLAGKLAADVVFYIPTITAYELRQRLLA